MHSVRTFSAEKPSVRIFLIFVTVCDECRAVFLFGLALCIISTNKTDSR